MLTLTQTGESVRHPVVLVGDEYWSGLLAWMHEQLLAGGRISPGDLDLAQSASETSEIVAIACAGADVAGYARCRTAHVVLPAPVSRRYDARARASLRG